MATLKSKKTFIILIISILLLCALIGLCIYLFTLPKADTWKEPIDTEVLLPEPSSVMLYYGEQKYVLSQEVQNIVFQTISKWIENATDCTHFESNQADRLADVRFEFDYDRSYQYIGSLGTNFFLSEKPFAYSAISVGWECSDEQVAGLKMYLTPFHNGKYYGIDNTITALSLDLNYYGAEFDELLLKALLNTSYNNSSETVVESNTFPARPDYAVLHKNGQIKMLSGAELDVAYNVFMNLSSKSFSPNRTFYASGYATKQLLDYTSIEFCYTKRQKYTPDTMTNGEYNDEIVSVQSAYGGKEYDAILCIIQEKEPAIGIFNMEVGLYVNSSYDLSRMRQWPWYIGKDFLSYLPIE